jgi:hypothetical protein
MDSVCAETNATLTTTNSAESNGNAMENNDANNVAAVDAVVDVDSTPTTSSTSTTQNQEPATYDDLFPSLPAGRGNSGPGGASGSTPIGEWNRKPMLLSTSVTQVFHIPVEERKDQASGHFGGGSAEDSYKLIKGVMEKTGAKIEMSSNKDQSLTFLISGKQETVLKARRELLVQFQTQASMSIPISKEHHRFILGKNGAKLHELEQRTSTKISMPKVSDQSEKITISGPKEGIEKAIHEIQVISDEQSKQSYEVLQIPKIFHPFISGPSNENTKKMLADHPNVRINIPPLSVMKDELSVAGETEGVVAVKGLIMSIYKDIVSIIILV